MGASGDGGDMARVKGESCGQGENSTSQTIRRPKLFSASVNWTWFHRIRS